MLSARGIPMVYGVYEPGPSAARHVLRQRRHVNTRLDVGFLPDRRYGLTAMKPIGTNGMKPSLESLYYYLWMIEEAKVKHPWYISIWGQGALTTPGFSAGPSNWAGHIKTGLELFYDPDAIQPTSNCCNRLRRSRVTLADP
jgi:hypothetical protein